MKRSASGSASSARERLVDDRAMVGLADHQPLRLRAPLDGDLLLDHVERPRLALELVDVAVDPLDEQVLTSAITFVNVQATSLFWPMNTPGIPGSAAPRQKRSSS